MSDSLQLGYPLSPQQLRLIGVQGTEVPVRSMTFQVPTSTLAADEVARRARAVIRRHEALRTTLTGFDGALFRQSVGDVGGLDVVTGRDTVTLTAPAGCCDTASLVRVACELLGPVPAAGEVVQYGQFCAWQDEIAADGIPPAAVPPDRRHLSVDGPAEGPGDVGGLAHVISLTDGVPVTALRVAEQAGLPVADVVAALWNGFLARRLGGAEVMVGLRLAGRLFDELAETVGALARTLPVTCAGVTTASIRSLAGHVRRQREEYAELWVGGELPAVRHDARFALQFEHVAQELPAGVRVTSLVDASEPGRLALFLIGDGPGMQLLMAACDDLAAGLPELSYGFAAMVRAAVPQLDRAVSGLPVVHEGRPPAPGSGPGGDPAGADLAARFREVARAHPARPALYAAGGTAMTYGELDRRSDHLAGGFIARGAGPGRVVAIRDGPATDVVTAVVAALKAGAAFAVIDPGAPEEQLRRMIAALAPVVTVDAGDDAREGTSLAELAAAAPAAAPPTDPGSLAHVVFTSGTTGWPRPVAVTRADVGHYLDALLEILDRRAGRVYGTVASLSVDLGYTALYGALLSGGCVKVLDREVALTVDGFARWVADVDVVKTTPSHIQALLNASAAGPGPLLPREALLLGGEPFPRRLAEELLAVAGSRVVANHYGPAECCIGASLEVCDKGNLGDRATVPIGAGLGGSALLVLDRNLQECPPGVPGEIVILGAGVGYGYLADPATTAVRFVPARQRLGERMYRTGDLGVRAADGRVTHLGRLDDQVNIRGFRVEPGAIEAHLLAHPQVAQAVAVPQVDPSGNTRLVAYVSQTKPDEKGLHDQIVGAWTAVFEDLYGGVDPRDPQFRVAGWESSYTGRLMTDAEIQDSVDGIVGRILAQTHDRVLEIGCGTGMLLEAVAPHTASYVATDISGAVVDALRARVAHQPWADRVELRQAPAFDLSFLAPGRVDVVVINSTIQYFPSARYLIDVLTEALRVTAPGGCVFVGDVRDARMVGAFEQAVALHRADGADTVAAALEIAAEQARRDEELVVAPGFFPAFAARYPDLTATVLAKRGRLGTELTRYRYDVLLRRRLPAGRPPEPEVRPWRHTDAPGTVLEPVDRSTGLVLLDVPDARAGADPALLAAAAGPAGGTTVGEIRARLRPDPSAVAPEAWEAVDRRVHVQPARSGRAGCYDVQITDGPPSWDDGTRHDDLSDWCSSPASRAALRTLPSVLEEFLGARLPEHARPHRIIALPTLPMTTGGKVDRRALIAAADRLAPATTAGRAPEGPLEELVARCWSGVLGVEGLSAEDDFFQAGGHSLLAVQVVHLIRTELGVGMPLRDFFDRRTIKGQAEWLEPALERMLEGET